MGEFVDAGLTRAVRYALEGDAWLFADRDGWLESGERTAALLEALRSVEQEPSGADHGIQCTREVAAIERCSYLGRRR